MRILTSSYYISNYGTRLVVMVMQQRTAQNPSTQKCIDRCAATEHRLAPAALLGLGALVDPKLFKSREFGYERWTEIGEGRHARDM